MQKVTIVVPLYNEEEMFPLYLKKADELFKDNDKYTFDYLFINDGSKDQTLELVKKAAEERKDVSYISFSRNFGQDPALAAGLAHVDADVVITMDCDFQDPPELVYDMLQKYEEGYQVVQPQRRSRKADTWLKRNTSKAFYHFINKISGREVIPPNTSQFKLLSRKAVAAFNSLPEKMKVIRSEVAFVGFKTCFIPFDRKARAAGKSKYNYHKLFQLAFHTITCSTSAPLDWPLVFGVFSSAFWLLSFLVFFILFCIGATTFNGPISNYGFIWQTLSVVSAVFLAVGILSCIIGVPSLYLKDINTNTQGRPTFVIDEVFDSEKSKNK
jgi:glycosyltransferase involved in cell wall biosynthesis